MSLGGALVQAWDECLSFFQIEATVFTKAHSMIHWLDQYPPSVLSY